MQLSELGLERSTSAEQTVYLIELATKFQRLVSLSLNATHGADDAFETSLGLCIAPAVMSRMKIFSHEMAEYGEAYSFSCNDRGIPPPFEDDANEESFGVRKEDDPEDLVDMLHPHENVLYQLHGST
jgi:hypothetical protein